MQIYKLRLSSLSHSEGHRQEMQHLHPSKAQRLPKYSFLPPLTHLGVSGKKARRGGSPRAENLRPRFLTSLLHPSV